MENRNWRHTQPVAVLGGALIAAALSGAARLAAQTSGTACAAVVSVRDSTGVALPEAAVLVGDGTVRTDSAGDARFILGSAHTGVRPRAAPWLCPRSTDALSILRRSADVHAGNTGADRSEAQHRHCLRRTTARVQRPARRILRTTRAR